MKGGKVCSAHGGKAPQVMAVAKRREAEAQARRRFARRYAEQGIPDFEDAVTELERVIAETIALKDVAREAFDQLAGDIRYEHDKGGEQLRAEVAFYERMLDSTGKKLIEYERLGISERKVRLAEAQAQMLVMVIRNILERLGLNQRQKNIAGVIVAEELRAITGGGE